MSYPTFNKATDNFTENTYTESSYSLQESDQLQPKWIK